MNSFPTHQWLNDYGKQQQNTPPPSLPTPGGPNFVSFSSCLHISRHCPSFLSSARCTISLKHVLNNHYLSEPRTGCCWLASLYSKLMFGEVPQSKPSPTTTLGTIFPKSNKVRTVYIRACSNRSQRKGLTITLQHVPFLLL